MAMIYGYSSYAFGLMAFTVPFTDHRPSSATVIENRGLTMSYRVHHI
jgi:hypothetical protein